MPTHADKTKENNRQSLDSSIAQNKNVGTKGFEFVDNRAEAVAQRTLQEMANNNNVRQFKKEIIQRETPGEKIARENPNYPEDQNYALIGSDNPGISPVAVELQYCIDNGMEMPAYLSKYLEDTRQVWGQPVNNEWMRLMTERNKIFLLTHSDIADLLNNGGKEAFEKAAKNKKKGTWNEVKILFSQKYIWYPEAQIFLPPILSPGQYEQWDKERMEARE